MKIIKKLTCLIDEELGDAQKYAELALKYKDDDKELSALFYNLSLEETRHMNQLHNAVVQKIDSVKGKEIPEGMKIAYDILHERAIEKAKEVAVMQSMYRE